ncbi:MAG: ACP S-malonyltransferase [Gammaproteobacteria bacterium]|nr:ACP S-malonyltransferase [Gammaproteobacteria bacterium]
MSNKFAVVFPGQGSQQVGMISDLASEYSLVKDTFDEASEVLNYNLWELVQNGPAEKLNQTVNTQPALLVASTAIWRVYDNIYNNLINNSNYKPSILAGHSLGEYTALVAAGSLDFKDAVALVSARGRFMQEAVPTGEGAMAAVLGLNNTQDIQNILNNIPDVEIANLNAIGQTVIAGRKDRVLEAVDALKSSGAKLVKLLDVSVPSHCSLMQPAAQRLQELIHTIKIKSPCIPVIHNYSVQTYNNPQDIKNSLVNQLISPVRWVETVQYIYNKNDIAKIYEFGPGSVLTKLCKRIEPEVTAEAIDNKESLENIFAIHCSN